MAATKNSQRKSERILLVLVLGVFAAAVVNLSLFSFRLDLTSAGAYSISPASKAVFAQAKDEISVTYYLSKKLTTYYPFTQGIADFLEEYAAASNGRVKVRVVDPQDTGELTQMARLGLQSIPIDIVEQSQQTQAVVYSGILLQYQNRQEVLPQVSQIETLEYDLTSKVNKLVTQKTKTVAFLSADPTKTLQQYYSVLSQSLTQTAVFREVQPGEAIGDASVLIVAGSKGFTPAVLKPVDDYLMKGGKVLFAVDGVFVDISSAQAPVVPAGENDLLRALETYGVKVEQGLVLDSYNNVVQFQTGQGVALRRYPLWPEVLAKNTSATNPVTSRFPGLTLMWASPLTDLHKAGITTEVLATTSEKSWVAKDNLTIDVDRASQSGMMPGVKFGKQNVVLALSGSFPSAQPGGGASPATRILVVGSSNLLTNLMQVTGKDENAVFAENAVDWLAQDEGLLGIKTRAYRDKSLTLLQDAQVRDSAAFALSFVNLFLVPVIILAWAVVRMVRRRRKEDRPRKGQEK
jgi:gliding-associated putative ABC transporter substrate-binding component GldG